MPYMVYITLEKTQSQSIVAFLQKELLIQNITILPGIDPQRIISFRCRDARVTEIVQSLTDKGVGVDFGIVDVISIVTTKPYLSGEPDDSQKKDNFSKRKLMIEYIYSTIFEQSNLSLDYLLYCFVGAVLAAIGLATNSSVTIVAAMLVSPLMGPIVGIAVGCVVKSGRLVKTAVKCELAGIAVVYIIGILAGIVFSPFRGDHAFSFPTFQMLDRGIPAGILFGAAIAFVSGIGVALSVSQGAVNSLVGVAISAAVLPPICNSGMLLSIGILLPIMPQVSFANALNPPSTTAIYKTKDYIIMSLISLTIFVINFLFICITSIIIFKMKKFQPFSRRPNAIWTPMNPIEDPQLNKNEGTLLPLTPDIDIPVTGHVEVSGSNPFMKRSVTFFEPKFERSIDLRLSKSISHPSHLSREIIVNEED